MGKRTRRFGLVALVLGMTIGAAGRAEAGLIGNDFASGTLYDVSTTTGLASNPRSTGLSALDGITTRPSDGSIFGLTNAGSLYRIDPTTGVSSLVGATGFSFIEGDLAFNPTNGKLYGIQEFSTGTYRLALINPNTAAATIVGTMTGVFDLSAGAFSANGTFYMIDTGVAGVSHLLTVNPLNAAIMSNIATNVDLGGVAGLTFDPLTDTAYVAEGGGGGTNNLYSLNVTTGNLTPIGPTGLSNGLAGLTFTATTSAAVPEPSSLALCGVAGLMGLGLAWRRRRRAA